MAKKKGASAEDVADATERLKLCLPPGTTVYTILRHVSSSGMSQEISPVVVLPDGNIHTLNYAVSDALGMRLGGHRGLVLRGCGMDMGFHLVYCIASHLYGEGYACLGEGKCPSNYHVNYRMRLRCVCLHGEECTLCDSTRYVDNPEPERFDLTHTDGYALRQRWL